MVAHVGMAERSASKMHPASTRDMGVQFSLPTPIFAIYAIFGVQRKSGFERKRCFSLFRAFSLNRENRLLRENLCWRMTKLMQLLNEGFRKECVIYAQLPYLEGTANNLRVWQRGLCTGLPSQIRRFDSGYPLQFESSRWVN